MKKTTLSIFTLLLLIIFPCASKNSSSDNTKPLSTQKKDSIYFSFSSACNFQLNILSNNNAILSINGKNKKGTITKNKYSKGFYDFKEKNTTIITFSFEDSNIIVENQKYQFSCEGAKFIMLNKVKNDNESLNLIKNYFEETIETLDNVELINDKAYFLEKINQDKTSAYILERVIEKNPDRVVAWLKLGDVYWKLNKKKLAKKNIQHISI